MKKLIVSLVVLLFSQLAAANAPNGLPSFEETILKGQFPEYEVPRTEDEQVVLRQLRHYKFQLEIFREEVLEGFNDAVQEHIRKLVESDQKLELDRKKGRITKEQYIEMHQYIKSELDKSNDRKKGYMKVYFSYLKKYKTYSKWVAKEVDIEEKKSIIFP